MPVLLAGGRCGIGSMERTGRSPSKSSASSGSSRDLDYTRTSTLKYTTGAFSSRCSTLSWDSKESRKSKGTETIYSLDSPSMLFPTHPNQFKSRLEGSWDPQVLLWAAWSPCRTQMTKAAISLVHFGVLLMMKKIS